jgi:hypothetical protein
MTAYIARSPEPPVADIADSEFGPFGAEAVALADCGLAVMPVGGKDGKQPLVKWANLKRPFGPRTLRKLADIHGSANIGVICGLSQVSVVDIDDPSLTETMIAHFGKTPLMTETPSGGVHLWYRCNDERSGNLRSEGLAVDIKARGGFVVAPPSIRPTGPYTGKQYRLIRGSWNDLRHLPQMSSGNIKDRRKADGTADVQRLRSATEGRRNEFLFRTLLREVMGCEDLASLRDVARHINDSYRPPLGDDEVCKTAASAWQYHINGRNWAGTAARVVTCATDLHLLLEFPDALALILLLKASHGDGQQPFAVSPKAMAKARCIADWGSNRYAVARNWLLEQGMLVMVHQGGSGTRDPSLFTLPKNEVGRVSIQRPI